MPIERSVSKLAGKVTAPFPPLPKVEDRIPRLRATGGPVTKEAP